MEVNVGMNNNNNGGGLGGHGGRLAEQCPRCYSRNTKFCYFNNYSLNQPRHYCRACKRHWTKGGACRVVPVGGNRHKNRRARVGLGPPARRQARVYSGGGTAWPTAVAGRSSNVVVSGGRITNFPDPVDARVSAYRRSMSSNLSFLQELNNVVSNNVSLGFGNFPPLPPLSGGGAWQEESLWMSSGNPSDHMFLWGLDGATGSGLCRHENGLPALNDIDFINNNHWADLPEFSPPPPPSSG